MRKALSVILFVFLSSGVSGQLIGDGSYANPYSGTLAGDANWSGTVYVNNDITVDNETLTISAGTKVIFLAEAADLKITGTGQLTAVGTSGSMITFTADDDNDGNYGEPGERWGHISFDGMGAAPASQITYCIIEYGRKTGTAVEGYGGGLQMNYNSITVSYSIIRNNYAQWGGGIFINANRTPSISNCLIKNNQSAHAGGGIYCWNGSGSVITNCIFEGNQCLEPSVSYYTGGGLAAQSNTSVKVVNCTFVNNTSTQTDGQALLYHSSPNGRIVNSVFWGAPVKQLYLYGTTANILINDAYRGITHPVGTPVSPIILNSDNNAADGPNFVATDGSDWSLKFISPCIDNGVDSYSGITVPSTDYADRPKVATKDRGAWETQYSRWNGSTSDQWSTSSNWDGSVDPASGTGDVVIPAGLSNYPTGSVTQDFTIASGKQMIVNAGAAVTLDQLTNNGTLKLLATSSQLSSLIINSYSRGGGASEDIQLYLTGGYIGDPGNQEGIWHYISSPVSSLSRTVFTVNTYDLAQWVDGIQGAGSIREGWVAYDGYIYLVSDPGDPLTWTGPQFNTLIVGQGYNFWDDLASNTYSLSGQLNTSDVSVNLSYAGQPYENGFNLLGNPFMAGLDWDDIINETYFSYPANTSKSLYFTRDNTQCSYVGGVGDPGDVTGIIPPMQGFFVKTYETGHSITLPAAARTHSSIHPRYKSYSIIPLVRLSVTDAAGSSAETVVRFDTQAKSYLDNDFDAIKMTLNPKFAYMYTTLSGVKYAINGLPYPGEGATISIPVVVNVSSTGTHTLSVKNLQGLENYYVGLVDNLAGSDTTDLRQTRSVTFTASKGIITGRFVIVMSAANAITDPIAGKNTFVIYPSGGFINIKTISDRWNGKTGSVSIFDMTGRVVYSDLNREFTEQSLLQIPSPGTKGIYFVEVRSGKLKYVGKVVIR